ncbi:Chalcone isomerase [Trema orientale]|uniref:Chalcone isomerase n=1 Tax=Trema orientale TaxID=63057 RepID=A0A2P5BFT3_TREOI|nr:Chalcone isomerase [Trema orientale]
MATTLDDVTVTDVNSKSQNPEKENGLKSKEAKEEAAKDSGKGAEEPKDEKAEEGKVEDEEVAAVEVEAKTGVAFPVKLDDGKRLNCVGLRKKSMLGLGIKIYGFGVYADNEKLKDLVKSKIGKSPAKPTKEMYQLVIDGDFGMTVRMVLVYSGVTMSMIKKNFDEVIGASIKKLNGGKKNDELSNK